MRPRTFHLLPCCFLAPALAAAEPERLSGATLSKRLPGATIEIDTPIGTKIPMRFSSDGLVAGEAGVLSAYLGAARDRGRWWVASDRLCIKWFRWFDSAPRCMDIQLDGARVFWRKEDGESGTATLAEAPKPAEPTPAPTARSELPDTALQQPAPRVVASEASEPPADTTPVRAPETQSQPSPAPVAGAGEPPASAPSIPSIANTGPVQRPARSVTASAAGPVNVQRPARSATAPKPAKTRIGKMASAVRDPASFRVARVEPDDMLNVRSAPSEYSRAVGIISPGGRGVKIVGSCHGDWCPIRHGGLKGWVNRYYLALENADPRMDRAKP